MPPGRRVEHAVDHPSARLLGRGGDAPGEPVYRREARRRRRVAHGVHQFVGKHLLNFIKNGAVDERVQQVVVDADPGRADVAHRAPLRNIAERRHGRLGMAVGGRVRRAVLI